MLLQTANTDNGSGDGHCSQSLQHRLAETTRRGCHPEQLSGLKAADATRVWPDTVAAADT